MNEYMSRRDFTKKAAYTTAGIAAGLIGGAALTGCGGKEARDVSEDVPSMPEINYSTDDITNYMIENLKKRDDKQSFIEKFTKDVDEGSILYVPVGNNIRVVHNKFHVLAVIPTDNGTPINFDPYESNLLPYETSAWKVTKTPGKINKWLKDLTQ